MRIYIYIYIYIYTHTVDHIVRRSVAARRSCGAARLEWVGCDICSVGVGSMVWYGMVWYGMVWSGNGNGMVW